jgi:outer membrane protein OmpA-like peptidoglycan-associated protein/opacity protein-like surface antigen
VVALALLVFAGAAQAQVCTDDLGVGVTVGMTKPSGGDEDFEEPGLLVGLQVKKLLNDRMSFVFDYHRGVTEGSEPSIAETQELGGRFSTWGEPDNFRTVWNQIGLTGQYCFMPGERVNPFVAAGLGITFWEVQDWRDEASEEGEVPDGYDTDGIMRQLDGTNLTATVGLGVELFATERIAVTLGGRYHYLLQNDVDNVGWSTEYGANYVDANSSLLEGYVGVMYYFGAGDCDGDGIIGKADQCWKDPEDFDGFEDEDGCPDPDNDGDGILDVDDECPDDAEDFDGEDDDDGCPDVDRDGDGILDDVDRCPDDPEDHDGFKDEDGCPDPDNDGDGVLDGADKCPDTPKGVEVDEKGCPKPKAELVAVMVNFDLDESDLKDEGILKLDALVKLLLEEDDVVVEIDGHACDLGSAAHNQKLSEDRAAAVEAYLIDHGIDAGRIGMKAFGDTQPLVPNDTEEQRRMNRRATITPTRK